MASRVELRTCFILSQCHSCTQNLGAMQMQACTYTNLIQNEKDVTARTRNDTMYNDENLKKIRARQLTTRFPSLLRRDNQFQFSLVTWPLHQVRNGSNLVVIRNRCLELRPVSKALYPMSARVRCQGHQIVTYHSRLRCSRSEVLFWLGIICLILSAHFFLPSSCSAGPLQWLGSRG